MPPNNTVKPCVWFIEDTNPDAVGAITLIACPKLKALFRINIPFVDSVVIGQGRPLCGGFVEADGLPWT